MHHNLNLRFTEALTYLITSPAVALLQVYTSAWCGFTMGIVSTTADKFCVWKMSAHSASTPQNVIGESPFLSLNQVSISPDWDSGNKHANFFWDPICMSTTDSTESEMIKKKDETNVSKLGR